jgi:capsid portal protein
MTIITKGTLLMTFSLLDNKNSIKEFNIKNSKIITPKYLGRINNLYVNKKNGCSSCRGYK